MIHEFEKIDELAVNAYDNTKLHLFIFDHMTWDDDIPAHLAILQMKIENYITFIKQKSYIDALKSSTDFKTFEIIVYSAYDIPKKAVKFQQKYQKSLDKKKYSITIKFEVHHFDGI